jgi:hypothetical protein
MQKFLFAALFAAVPSLALGAEVHSSIKVDAREVGDVVELTLKTVPNDGLIINLEGPWKLEVKKADGLTLAKTTLTRGEFDEKEAQFKVVTTAKPAKPEGEIEYKYVAFVCTKDKTTCYRDVHEGKSSWKLAAK